ncbi:MAG: PAS domain S-box protein [Acidobacteriota bacterium]
MSQLAVYRLIAVFLTLPLIVFHVVGARTGDLLLDVSRERAMVVAFGISIVLLSYVWPWLRERMVGTVYVFLTVLGLWLVGYSYRLGFPQQSETAILSVLVVGSLIFQRAGGVAFFNGVITTTAVALVLLAVEPEVPREFFIIRTAGLAVVLAIAAWGRDRILLRLDRLSRVARHVRAAVFLLDREGRIEWASPGTEDLLGHDPTTLTGRDPFSLIDQTVEGSESIEDVRRALLEVHGKPRQLPFVHADGGRRWLRLSAYAESLPMGGRDRQVLLGEDITTLLRTQEELRAGEGRYEHMLRSMPVPVIIYRGGIIEFANQAAVRVSGVADPVGRSIFDFIHPDDHPRIRERIREIFDHGAASEPLPVRLRHADGHVFEVESVGTRVLWQQHEAVQAVFIDLRERAHLAAVHEAVLQRLDDELRRPLARLASWLDQIADDTVAEEERAAKLRDSRRLVTESQRLLVDLLELQRLETGTLPLAFRPRRLMPVVEAAIDRAIEPGRAAGVRIELIREGGEVEISADPDRLARVFDYLLIQAVHSSPRGEVVSVAVDRMVDGVRVTVSDRGPVPSEVARQRLLGQKPSRNDSPVSIGFALTRALIEAHGGELGLDPSHRKGAAFTVLLPEIDP